MSEVTKTAASEQMQQMDNRSRSFSLSVTRFFCVLLSVVSTFLGEHQFIPVAALSIYCLSIASKYWYLAVRQKGWRNWCCAIGCTSIFLLFVLLVMRSLLLRV